MKPAHGLIPLFALALAVASVARMPSPDAVKSPIQQWQTIEANMDVPPAVARIVARACSNCHSNETVWPWYSRLAPINWFLVRDVTQARAAMNFSTWSSGAGRTPAVAASTLAAACADVRSDRMPLAPYRLLHPESHLSRADKQLFCDWANRSSREMLSRRLPVEP